MSDRRRQRLAAIATSDWAGRCAFVLACGLAIGWSGALLIATLALIWRETPVSQQGANLLSTLGGAIAGAVATYLGTTLHHLEGARMSPDKPAHPITPPPPEKPEPPDRPGGRPEPDNELPEPERPQPKRDDGRRGD